MQYELKTVMGHFFDRENPCSLLEAISDWLTEEATAGAQITLHTIIFDYDDALDRHTATVFYEKLN